MENYEKKEVYRDISWKIICVMLILFGTYLAVKYVFGVIAPFLIASVVSLPVRFFARKSSKKFGGNKKYWGAFYISLFWLMSLLFAIFSLYSLLLQMEEFFTFLLDSKDGVANGVCTMIENLSEYVQKIPVLGELLKSSGGELGEEAGNSVSEIVKSVAETGMELVASAVGGLILGTPRALVSTAACVISSVYISVDGDKIKEYFFGVVSKENSKKIKSIVQRLRVGAKGYLRAYAVLYLINFLQLFFGLFLLRRKFAFIIALIVGFFDVLPFFSAAVVLVPWGIVLFSQGNFGIGISLIILSAVMAVIRQVAEPRLIGKSLGLHPLASLFSMYVGMRFFGFFGMIFAPIAALMIKELFEKEKKREKII